MKARLLLTMILVSACILSGCSVKTELSTEDSMESTLLEAQKNADSKDSAKKGMLKKAEKSTDTK